MRRLLSLLCLATLAVDAFAADAADTLAFKSWQGPSWGSYVKMLLALAVVLALIWIVLSILRRTMGLRGTGLAGVQLMGGIPLGQRKSLQFIKVGDALYLIGATDHHLGLIAKIDDPAEIQRVLAAKSSAPQSFGSLLNRLTGRSQTTATGNAPTGAGG